MLLCSTANYLVQLLMITTIHISPAIPGLSDPVANKKALGTIFRFTSVFTSFAYSVIGIVMGSAFGKGIQESSNLNWKGFGRSKNEEDGDSSWLAEMAAFYIILFPALDVLSAFPLNAITLGNNMFGAYYGDKVHEVEHTNRGAKITFRLLASVPPVIGALFVRELGEITDYVGTVSVNRDENHHIVLHIFLVSAFSHCNPF